MMLASSSTGKDVYRAVDADDYKKLRKALKVERKDIKRGETIKLKGLDVDWRNADGRTPLMIAANKGNADNVAALIYCSASLSSRDKDGNTPLHFACDATGDSLAALEELIASSSSSDLDYRNRQGETALHRAATHGKEGHCNRLLQAGANCGLYNVAGLTCLDVAAINNKPSTCSLLLQGAPKLRRSTRALFEAVHRGYLDVARVLLEGGIPSDVVDPDSELGDSALHEAVRTGNVQMVKLLVTHSATVGKPNNRRETSLDIAADKPEIIKVLQDADSIEKYIPHHPESMTIRRASIAEYPLLRTKWQWSCESAQYRSSSTADHGVHSLLDNDPKTYMTIAMADDGENFVVFDFGREYLITGIRICGNSSQHMMKDFTLQHSPTLDGPWAVAKTFTTEQKGPDSLGDFKGENQDFLGFSIKTRFLKLVIDANYGSFQTCINGVGFFGVDGGLEGWLKEFGLERLLGDFINLGYTQVADMWMLSDNEIKRLCKGDTKMSADLIAAIRAAEERENRLSWLDFSKPPVRQHLEGKRLPDFTVIGDPGCRDEIELVFHGDPLVKGETRKLLERDPQGGPSVATFAGIVLSPPGNFIIEARSVQHPEIFVHAVEPTSISFMMKDKNEVDELFGEMQNLLNL